MSHIKESTHYYTRDGKPAYTVVGANGKERDTTLRDARKMGLLPSVTSIIKCAAAPGLELWKSRQVMLAALTLPRNGGESDDAYFDRIMRDSKEQAKKAAEKGTEIHAAIQAYFDEESVAGWGWAGDYVEGVCDQLDLYCSCQKWVAERSFAHPLGFGGKVDLSSDEWVIDFKTKEFGKEDELKTWDEHAMQLAAYDAGLGGKHRQGAIIYVSTTNPGVARFLEVDKKEMLRGWGMFEGLLTYYKAKTGYYPEDWQEAA